jgi:hypothetical protein
MNISFDQLPTIVGQMLEGAARLQARQEMLECVVRALIAEAPPIHPLVAKALRTAKSDLEQRAARARNHTPPEIDAAALALWNELWSACAPPAGDSRAAADSRFRT